MESLACLLQFLQPGVRKSGDHSSLLLDIKVLTLELKFGPHSELLGHNAFELNVAWLWKTHGLPITSLSITTQPSELSWSCTDRWNASYG